MNTKSNNNGLNLKNADGEHLNKNGANAANTLKPESNVQNTFVKKQMKTESTNQINLNNNNNNNNNKNTNLTNHNNNNNNNNNINHKNTNGNTSNSNLNISNSLKSSPSTPTQQSSSMNPSMKRGNDEIANVSTAPNKIPKYVIDQKSAS